MRKIDKSERISEKYHQWLEELNKNNKPHPGFSNKKKYKLYYDDVVMNLLYCQKGLCAYTEKFLCGKDLLTGENWVNGKYAKAPEKIGELDHFNPDLKGKKFWEWDNLFVILESVNRRKSKKKVFEILKPDSQDYDPFKFLDYDKKTNRFVVNGGIKDPDQIDQIEYMIDTLKLNFGPIKSEREEYLNLVKFDQEYSSARPIYQFFTAYEMSKK